MIHEVGENRWAKSAVRQWLRPTSVRSTEPEHPRETFSFAGRLPRKSIRLLLHARSRESRENEPMAIARRRAA